MKSISFWMSALLITLPLASCSSKAPEHPAGNNSAELIVSTTPPFKTREPERYRAVRTITYTNPAGESKITRTEIARSNLLRRERDSGEPVVLLESETGRFLMLEREKIYADVTGETSVGTEPDDLDNSPERLLHTGSLTSTYEKIGDETIEGRATNKYKVSVNNSSAGNVSIETTIWLDEKIGMPIRSESKASDGSKTVMELSQLDLNVDQSLFEIPEDFQKVTPAELRRRMKY